MIKKGEKKFYKTIVRPSIMFGSERWALNKKDEIKMKVDMRIPRWMYDVTMLDRIRNGRI